MKKLIIMILFMFGVYSLGWASTGFGPDAPGSFNAFNKRPYVGKKSFIAPIEPSVAKPSKDVKDLFEKADEIDNDLGGPMKIARDLKGDAKVLHTNPNCELIAADIEMKDGRVATRIGYMHIPGTFFKKSEHFVGVQYVSYNSIDPNPPSDPRNKDRKKADPYSYPSKMWNGDDHHVTNRYDVPNVASMWSVHQVNSTMSANNLSLINNDSEGLTALKNDAKNWTPMYSKPRRVLNNIIEKFRNKFNNFFGRSTPETGIHGI